MDIPPRPAIGRRAFLGASAASLAALAVPAAAQDGTTEFEGRAGETVRRNMSGFRALRWEPYFADLRNGAILVDIDSRAVHFWGEGGALYKLYPSSVPLSEDLTRRGRSEVVFKDPNPSWRPTPAMKLRNPEWPDFVPPGPDNPLGTRALRLSWQYYRIHGTHDTRKIGRRSSNGCIGLYNEHIEELFELAKVGTQVLLV